VAHRGRELAWARLTPGRRPGVFPGDWVYRRTGVTGLGLPRGIAPGSADVVAPQESLGIAAGRPGGNFPVSIRQRYIRTYSSAITTCVNRCSASARHASGRRV